MQAVVTRNTRYHLLDILRGVTLLSMMVYHAVWDLVYLAEMPWHWFDSLAAEVWQKSICCSFILLSGFCWSMGRSKWRNGIRVSLAGLLITIVTILAVPEEAVWFGILTLLGACMLLMIPLEKLLQHIPPLLGIAGSMALFTAVWSVNQGMLLWCVRLPRLFYHGGLLSNGLGFQTADFYSSDYFPLLPWFFLFAAGYFLFCMARESQWLEHPLLCRGSGSVFAWLGRHSLLIYLLHQPVLFGLVLLTVV